MTFHALVPIFIIIFDATIVVGPPDETFHIMSNTYSTGLSLEHFQRESH